MPADRGHPTVVERLAMHVAALLCRHHGVRGAPQSLVALTPPEAA